MSKWDEVGALFEEISCLRGGPHDLYKPVIRIEYYEHDECWNVQVGQCKSLHKLVVDISAETHPPIPMNGDCADQLLLMLKKARAICGECE